MNFLEKLLETSEKNNSLVCIGLDYDPLKVPEIYGSDIFAFNKAVIDASIDLAACYKPNAAFYEALGDNGVQALRKTIKYIDGRAPVILDAKRGDIGNTSRMYAKSAFEDFNADAITVSPYMGIDSLDPFFEYEDKGVFILCLTSNKGSMDFQKLYCDGVPLYLNVAGKVDEWQKKFPASLGLVVGATNEELAEIRDATSLPFLIPGIGAQGGDLEGAVKGACSNDGFCIINSSRGILYPSDEGDHAENVRKNTLELRDSINQFI